VFRTRARLRPWWVTAFHPAVIVPADFVMSRQMLGGVKERAERTTAADLVRLASRPSIPEAADVQPGTLSAAGRGAWGDPACAHLRESSVGGRTMP
jgi:hypothetical protein